MGDEPRAEEDTPPEPDKPLGEEDNEVAVVLAESLAKAIKVSGKFGGVAGVFFGVLICVWWGGVEVVWEGVEWVWGGGVGVWEGVEWVCVCVCVGVQG